MLVCIEELRVFGINYFVSDSFILNLKVKIINHLNYKDIHSYQLVNLHICINHFKYTYSFVLSGFLVYVEVSVVLQYIYSHIRDNYITNKSYY